MNGKLTEYNWYTNYFYVDTGAMEASLYRFHTVPRNITYHYFYSPSQGNRSTLLFLHGFPASSYDWRRQISYFQSLGYGIVAPDLLGYGKTSKPEDLAAFRMNDMAGDMISILKTEGLEKVVGIAHDWGSVLLSRLSMLYQQHFLGFVWLGLSFMPPYTEKFDLHTTMSRTKEVLGYEGFSYWEYFNSESATHDIRNNIESYMQLLYPQTPSDWLTYMALPGKTEEWLIRDMRPGRPKYLSDLEFDKICVDFVETGITSPLCWYKSQINNVDLHDNKDIPEESLIIEMPSLFVAALRDYLCTPAMGRGYMNRFGNKVTTIEFEAGHWVHLEHSLPVNEAIYKWLISLNM